MKSSIAWPRSTTTLVVSLLFMLTSMTIPNPAVATLYTYTSQQFGAIHGPSFPATPAIGDSFTVRFNYDGVLPTVLTDMLSLVSFTMTSGEVELASGDPGVSAWFKIKAAAAVPTAWEISIIGMHPGFEIATWRGGYGGPVFETVMFHRVTGELDTWTAAGGVGTWTLAVVPVPPTMLLLGTGLIPLAWARRKRRLGK